MGLFRFAKLSGFRLATLMMCPVATISLISCTTSLDAHRQRMAGPSALETGHWTKVRNKPPTYIPKGTSSDQPADLGNGYWIKPGGPEGNHFFIPFHDHGPLSVKKLTAEAWAAATPAERARLEEEARHDDRVRTARKIVGLPLIMLPYHGGFVWLEL